MGSNKKEISALCKAIEAAGGEVRFQRRGGHLNVYKDGQYLITMSGSPRTDQGPRIAARQLTSLGLDVDYGAR